MRMCYIIHTLLTYLIRHQVTSECSSAVIVTLIIFNPLTPPVATGAVKGLKCCRHDVAIARVHSVHVMNCVSKVD